MYLAVNCTKIDTDDITYHPNKWIDDGFVKFTSTWCFRDIHRPFDVRECNTVYLPVNLCSNPTPVGTWGSYGRVSIPWLRTVKAYTRHLSKAFPTLDIRAGKTHYNLDGRKDKKKNLYYIRVRSRRKEEPADQYFSALCFARFLCTEYSYMKHEELYEQQKTPRQYLKALFEQGSLYSPGHFPASSVYNFRTALQGLIHPNQQSILQSPFGDAVYDFMVDVLPSYRWAAEPLTRGFCTYSGLQDTWIAYLREWYSNNHAIQEQDLTDEDVIDEDYEW